MTDSPAFARTPPNSPEAERALLGGLLVEPESFDDIASQVELGDFYLSAHRALFVTMLELRGARKPVDPVTILEALGKTGRLDDVGGKEALHALAAGGALGADLSEYATIVRERAIARGVIAAANDLARRAYDGQMTGSALVESMRATTTSLERSRSDAAVSVRDLLDDAFADIASSVTTRGIVTGLHALDEPISTGFEPGQLVLVGARPGMGKTALGVNLAMRIISAGTTVGFLSFEMTRKQVIRRLLASMASVPMKRLRGGTLLTDAEYAALDVAAQALRNGCAPLYIDDGSGPNTAVLRSKARALVERQGCGILFVDHLGLIRPPSSDRTIRSTVDVVSHVSRELKALAVDLRVPVVAMCQLSREAAKGNRGDANSTPHEPTLTDLRDSGSLEQDADMVLLLHRPGYYTKDPYDVTAKVIIAKQRDGETGVAKLAWNGQTQRFVDLAPEGA